MAQRVSYAKRLHMTSRVAERRGLGDLQRAMPNATDSSLLSTERRASLIIGLTIAVALDTAVQICWKVGAADIDDDIPLWASGNAVFEAPLFLLIGALM